MTLKIPAGSGLRAGKALLLLLGSAIALYWAVTFTPEPYGVLSIILMGLSLLSVVGILISNWYSLYLIFLYRKHAGPDRQPAHRYAAADLPFVTIQLPMYNEANVAERLIRSAAAVDYPSEKLQIQVIDDSSDETTEIVQHVFQDLKLAHPHIDFQHLRRPKREGWKAGALNYGLDHARGDLLAIFDADFLISKDFLQRTVHFFTDQGTGLVQGRWAFINPQYSCLTTAQASKLDAHQMFEQTARYRAGYWVFFHGTAGIWRKTTIESAGRWSSVTDIEDADLSIRALLKNWQFVYLNDLKVLSELPTTMGAYLTQQRRWKRGWLKIVQMYSGQVLRSQAPLPVRLDMLERLINMLATLMSLVVSTGALPIFLLGERLGVSGVVYGLYSLLLLTSLVLRVYEGKTTAWERQESMGRSKRIWKQLQTVIPFRMLLDMGTLWTWTVGTVEAWLGKSGFERTPKLNIVDSAAQFSAAAAPKAAKAYMTKARSLQLGTLFLGGISIACTYYAVTTAHWMSLLFYSLQLGGIGWVSGSLVSEGR